MANTLAKGIASIWAAFAAGGDPNHEQLPDWPLFSAERARPIFDDALRVESDPRASFHHFWRPRDRTHARPYRAGTEQDDVKSLPTRAPPATHNHFLAVRRQEARSSREGQEETRELEDRVEQQCQAEGQWQGYAAVTKPRATW